MAKESIMPNWGSASSNLIPSTFITIEIFEWNCVRDKQTHVHAQACPKESPPSAECPVPYSYDIMLTVAPQQSLH